MNPDTNRFEKLKEAFETESKQEADLLNIVKRVASNKLLRQDGSPVPDHWSVFQQGEHVVVKNYTFKVGYIGEAVLVLEPVGPYIIGDFTKE